MNLRVFSILLIILILNQFSYAQKIEPGKYVSVWKYDHITRKTVYNGEYGEVITILDSNKYKYRYRDDISDDRGFGFYKQGNKYLTLDFTDYPEFIDTTRVSIIDSILNDNDSLILEIEIKAYNKPLKDAWIGYYTGDTILYKKSSDKYGKVRFAISKKEISGLMQISYVGFVRVKFYINNVYSKRIIVKLDNFFNIITKGNSITYSIKDVYDDGFFVIGSIFSEWTFFKREE